MTELSILPEIILYGAITLFFIFLIATLLDYLNFKKKITKKDNEYISFELFRAFVKVFFLYRKKRFDEYIEIVDPITLLVLKKVDYDVNSLKRIGSKEWDKLLDHLFHKYLNYDKLEERMNKTQWLKHLNSDDFDCMSLWFDYPNFVFPYVFDQLPDYNLNAPLSEAQLNQIKNKLDKPETLKNIFSNSSLSRILSFRIEAIKELIESESDVSIIDHLKLELEMAEITMKATINNAYTAKENLINSIDE